MLRRELPKEDDWDALWKCQCLASLHWVKRESRITPRIVGKAFEYCHVSCWRRREPTYTRSMKHSLVQVPLVNLIPPICSASNTNIEQAGSNWLRPMNWVSGVISDKLWHCPPDPSSSYVRVLESQTLSRMSLLYWRWISHWEGPGFWSG